VQLGVEVLVAKGGNATVAARAATTTLPIVSLIYGGDPVANGIAASFARPGGNITGNTLLSAELAVKSVQLLKELVPKLALVGEFIDLTTPPRGIAFRRSLRDPVYASMGLQAIYLEVATTEDVQRAMAEFNRLRVDAVMLERELIVERNTAQILKAAMVGRMATMASQKQYVEAGALVSYAPSWAALIRSGARHVDQILKGVPPGEIPFEQPTTIELAINLKTAAAIGLAVPRGILIRADRVVQ